MEKKVSKSTPIVFFTFILTLSTLNILIYLSMRPFWYFINRDTKTPFFPGFPFTTLLFILYSASFIYSLILFIIFINKQKPLIKAPSKINVIIPSVLLVLFSGFNYYLFTRMEGDQYLVTSYLKSPYPYLITAGIIILLIFFNPNYKFSRIPFFYYTAVIVGIILAALCISGFGRVKITTGPNIVALNDKTIAVIWTTNKNSTSFVEYGPDKYHLKRAYMAADGLIEADTRTHRVEIPVPRDGSIVYRVSSTKINHYYQNNVDYGNTVVSNFKNYSNINSSGKLVFYTFNDVHENTDLYEKFLSKSNYDFIVLNGDAVNSLDKPSDITDKILKPLSVIGTNDKPFFLVRGNHETRGGAARLLKDYIAFPNNHFYYTISLGPIFVVVLDSGEDKTDDNVEYSGLADFKNYKEEETKWLQGVYESSTYKNAKFKVAFVHIPLNDKAADASASYLSSYQREWSDILNRMKIDLVFSGHTHVPELIKPDGRNYTFPIIIGGGPTDNPKKYIAVKTEVTQKEMKIYFISYDGTQKEVYSISRH